MTEYNLTNINWLAILVGAIIPLIIGFVWYHPKLFGTIWMKSLGLTEEDLKSGNMAAIFGVSILMAAVLAYAISSYMGMHPEEYQTFTHGLFHGGMAALTLAVPVLISNSMFERKNLQNILVNAIYWIGTLAIMGGVITVMS